jgi:RNA-binding protein Musashi
MLDLTNCQIEVKRAQPKGREREVEPRRPYERDRNFGGGGGGQFPGQNGFNGPQGGGGGMMNPMYGGMSPALMAQWYQRMQAYYATMGRGMMPAMGMGSPMMGMPNMNMQGMGMGGMPAMQGQMGGGGQPMMAMNPNMGGYQGVPMNQGFQSPPQQSYQQETSHEGEYTYDTGADQPSQQSPPPNSGEIPSGPRDAGPPPNAPTGPSSGVKPTYGGGPRGRGMMRGGRGFTGGSFPGGMARGGNVRYNPYSR